MAIPLSNYTQNDLLKLNTLCCIIPNIFDMNDAKMIDIGNLRDYTNISLSDPITTVDRKYVDYNYGYAYYAYSNVTQILELILSFDPDNIISNWIANLYNEGHTLYILYMLARLNLNIGSAKHLKFSNIFQAECYFRVDYTGERYFNTSMYLNPENAEDLQNYTTGRDYGSSVSSPIGINNLISLTSGPSNKTYIAKSSYDKNNKTYEGSFNGPDLAINTAHNVYMNTTDNQHHRVALSCFLMSFKKPTNNYLRGIEGFVNSDSQYYPTLEEIKFKEKFPSCFIFG